MPSSSGSSVLVRESPEQIQRLVDWNSEILLHLLKQVVAKRGSWGWVDNVEPTLDDDDDQQLEGALILDEVTDAIDFPGFSSSQSNLATAANSNSNNHGVVEFKPDVIVQLKNYVSAVANAYHPNPFHCLQHASQVTMAVTKLLSRIVVDELDVIQEEGDDDEDDGDIATDELIQAHLHNHTFGITSDPLAQFGIVFAAFVHEVDHRGLSNEDICKLEPEAAALYHSRSITEQRSFEKAWKKLMEPEFTELRQCIYGDAAELKRFRQVVINSVLATDYDNQELQTLRTERWNKTFKNTNEAANAMSTRPSIQDVNRKATIVLEHLVQAADIFHTMQPWIVYEKWSSRRFNEDYHAYKTKRVKKDPSETWLQKELDFFDNRVIPLAMELKDCDAFIVSGDEYLNYALKNRQQLASTSTKVVPDLIEKYRASAKEEKAAAAAAVKPVFAASYEGEDVSSAGPNTAAGMSKTVQRLVDWNVEMLMRLLKQVVAKRNAKGDQSHKNGASPMFKTQKERIPLDEVADIIVLPDFDPLSSVDKLNMDSVEMSVPVVAQLREFVTEIALRFHDNPFHCLDRGSHVCMTARKLVSRIVTPTDRVELEDQARDLFDKTFGLSEAPEVQFAIVFAALIHDHSHPGVPNSQLVRENNPLAIRYRERSMIEQNAVDAAWELLLLPKFAELRDCIYSNEEEMKRFRQVTVNCVLATDSENRELVASRWERHQRAFVAGALDDSVENRNRRATVVIELVLQSADLFHATAHGQVCQKWNERLFHELYRSYQAGRLLQDPSISWYKMELLHFDDLVIPLTKRMSDCGVFDVSADEFMSFALANRQQWASKGGDLVASMMARIHGKEIEKIRARRRHRRMSLSATTA